MASLQQRRDSNEICISEIGTDDDRSLSGIDDDDATQTKGAYRSNEPAATGQQGDTASYNARINAYGLVGMTVDYDGSVLDNSKKSCGKASGDICEMVGQRVDEDGLIRNAAGEVVGQVAHNYGLEEAFATMLEAQKRMSGGDGGARTEDTKTGTKPETEEKKKEPPNIWQGTVGEGPPGDDIHLNVQSTKEGISISIRIPTLFAKEQRRHWEENAAADMSS